VDTRADIQAEKRVLRQRMRTARQAIGTAERRHAAEAMAELALALPELDGATAVLVYAALPDEANPSVLEAALRARGARIALPRVTGPRTLALHWVDDPAMPEPGVYGIREPDAAAPAAALAELSAVVAPGLAFDMQGNRLGHGGGYYDALLTLLPPGVPVIGVAYDAQIVDTVPHDEGDRQVDVVVTPTRVLRAE
jgi:5-formyltetrahydrofolate cyclo-ligase